MNQPMISCVMVTTHGRPQFSPSAFDCFVAQTYINKQLIVVTDEGYRKYFGDGGLALTHRWEGERVPQFATLGEKRNVANSLCDGELIAHWDDDDYSAPDRLLVQSNRLEAGGRAVCAMRTMYFVDQHGKVWLFTGGSMANLGTSLLYRREWWQANQFERVNRGEDKKLVERAYSRGQFELIVDRSLMVARHHEQTQEFAYVGTEWREASMQDVKTFCPGFEYGKVTA